MIIVDTGLWIDQLKGPEPTLERLLTELRALLHPYVLGEVSLGSLPARAAYIEEMSLLPQPPLAKHGDVLRLIEAETLHATGIGYVDAHLLASARLLPGARVWTRDKKLHMQAERLGVAFNS